MMKQTSAPRSAITTSFLAGISYTETLNPLFTKTNDKAFIFCHCHSYYRRIHDCSLLLPSRFLRPGYERVKVWGSCLEEIFAPLLCHTKKANNDDVLNPNRNVDELRWNQKELMEWQVNVPAGFKLEVINNLHSRCTVCLCRFSKGFSQGYGDAFQLFCMSLSKDKISVCLGYKAEKVM